jgi:CheY-like chemotaxis protein
MSDTDRKPAVHALLLCRDAQFLGTTRNVLEQIGGTPKVVEDCQHALIAIAAYKFDVIILDWREIDDLAEFLCAVRRSALNQDCVLVAIARDMLDVRQAFTAGVHFLIHKPASVAQIERCLRTAWLASVARRRKVYRAPVEVPASLGMRNLPQLDATLLNLGEGGAGVQIHSHRDFKAGQQIVGDSVSLTFLLAGTHNSLHTIGRIVWSDAAGHVGIQFTWMPDAERMQLEAWLTRRMEQSVAELRKQLAAVCA